MRNGAGYITRYRITWLVMLAVVILITLLLIFGRSVTPVAPKDVKPAVPSAFQPEQQYEEEPFADLIVNMTELELSLSSKDGALKVRLWARQAEKNQTGYAIADGVLQFMMEEPNTLILRVQDAALILADQTVEVSGSLVGHITGSDQFFEATRLTCDLNGTETGPDEVVYHVYTDKVVYRVPNIDVSGERMILELPSGIVKFEGKVEAGV